MYDDLKGRVISIKEPSMQLLLSGLKHYEYRQHKTGYRGVIFLHTSPRDYPQWFKNPVFTAVVDKSKIKRNMVIAKAILTDCVPADMVTDENEKKYGFYDDGNRYAWKIDNIEPIEPPIQLDGNDKSYYFR